MKDQQTFDAILKEYSTLRDEILMWSKSELTAVGVLFSIGSILFGYAISSHMHVLFLLIPLVTFAGTWLWLADHCMIKVIGTYISEEIEKKRILKVIGRMDDNSLWIGWDTFVQNMPKQLGERGADRTLIVIVLLWLNTLAPIYFAYHYMEALFLKYPILHLICIGYVILLGAITIYINRLSKKSYPKLLGNIRLEKRPS
jgi:hypothetical protein